MGHMKNIHIEMLNAERESSLDAYMNSELPLWMMEEYYSLNVINEELDNRGLVEIPFDDLTDEDKEKLWKAQDDDIDSMNL